MNWQKEAINDLNIYNARKDSVVNMKEKIAELEAKVQRLSSSSNNVPVQGGCSKNEDILINSIVERDRLKANIKAVLGWIRTVESGLNNLTEEERTALDGFYINRTTKHVDRLCDELCYEKTRIYEIKDRALRKFTIAMYGIIDL